MNIDNNEFQERKYISYIELFHKIFDQMASVIEEDPKRYPDSLFVDMITGLAAEGNFSAEFNKACEDGLKYISHNDSL